MLTLPSFPFISVRSIALVFTLSVAVALICSAIPWLARPLSGRLLVLALVLGLIVGVTAGVISAASGGIPLTWLTDLMVLVVAWSGGLLLGRGLRPRFRSFLLFFLCLSVIDVLLALGGYPQTPHTASGSSPLLSTNFILTLPWGRFAINVADLLLITAVAEHWRRRGAGYLVALLPGVLGFLLADGVIAVTGLAQLPGFPFFTVGYLVSEGVHHAISPPRSAPSASLARENSPSENP